MAIPKAKQTLNIIHHFFLITSLTLLATACTTTGQQNAPIERKESVYYKYNGPVAINNLHQHDHNSNISPTNSASHGASHNAATTTQENSNSQANKKLYNDSRPSDSNEIPPAKPTNQGPINEPNTLERQIEDKEINDNKGRGSHIYYDNQNSIQNEGKDSVDSKTNDYDIGNTDQKLDDNYNITEQNSPNNIEQKIDDDLHNSNQIKQSDQNAFHNQKDVNPALIDDQKNAIDAIDNNSNSNKTQTHPDDDKATNTNMNTKPQHEGNLQYNSYAIASPLGLSEFAWPVNGKVIRHMSDQPEEFKEGISIAAPEGTIVRCSADGEVIYAGNNQDKFGNLVIIKHAKGYLTAYAHNSDIMVKKGDKIKRGQPIAKVGTTGDLGKEDAPKSQLYFSIRKDRMVVNPEKNIGSK